MKHKDEYIKLLIAFYWGRNIDKDLGYHLGAFRLEVNQRETFPREAYHRQVDHRTTRSIEDVPNNLADLEVGFIAEDTPLMVVGTPYSLVTGKHYTLA